MPKIVIVGAGAAGCCLACRLSEDPRNTIVLLEAGADYRSAAKPRRSALRSPNPEFVQRRQDHKWPELAASRTADQAPQQYLRGKGLGGTACVSAMQAVRPLHEDFERWEALGCTGLGPVEAVAYLKRLERDLDYGAGGWAHGDVMAPGERHGGGEGARLPVSRAARSAWGAVDMALFTTATKLGHRPIGDANDFSPNCVGVAALPRHDTPKGGRRTPYDVYVEPLRGDRRGVGARKNLSLITEALVERVTFDEEADGGGGGGGGDGPRVTGVVVVAPSAPGGKVAMDADEVILCAGCLHTPAILQRSGVGAASMLAELGIPLVCDSTFVGANVAECPQVTMRVPLKGTGKLTAAEGFPAGKEEGRKDCRLASADSRDSGMMLRYSSGMHGGARHEQPLLGDMAIFSRNCDPALWSTPEGRMEPDSVPYNRFRKPHAGFANGGLILRLLEPRSVGSVTITTVESSVSPTVELNMLEDACDRERMRDGVHRLFEIVTQPSMVGIRSDLEVGDDAMGRIVGINWYGGGTVGIDGPMGFISGAFPSETLFDPDGSPLGSPGGGGGGGGGADDASVGSSNRSAPEPLPSLDPAKHGAMAGKPDELDAFLLAAAAASGDCSGSCRMGPRKNAESVVSCDDCSVYGTRGLKVLDSSILPTPPRGSVSVAVLAIAELMADRFLGRTPPTTSRPAHLDEGTNSSSYTLTDALSKSGKLSPRKEGLDLVPEVSPRQLERQERERSGSVLAQGEQTHAQLMELGPQLPVVKDPLARNRSRLKTQSSAQQKLGGALGAAPTSPRERAAALG